MALSSIDVPEMPDISPGESPAMKAAKRAFLRDLDKEAKAWTREMAAKMGKRAKLDQSPTEE